MEHNTDNFPQLDRCKTPCFILVRLMSALYVRLFFVQRRAVSEPQTPNIGLGQAIWSATHPSSIQLLGEYLTKASPLDLKFECEVNVMPSRP
jgi:hypothetical protein